MISKFMFEKKVRVRNWQNIGLGVKFWVGGKIRGDILGGGEIFGWGGEGGQNFESC